MTPFLSRAMAAVRVFLRLNDPADDRSYPTHGWLLPPLGRTLVLAKVQSPAPLTIPGRRP